MNKFIPWMHQYASTAMIFSSPSGTTHLMLAHFLHTGMACPVLVLTFQRGCRKTTGCSGRRHKHSSRDGEKYLRGANLILSQRRCETAMISECISNLSGEKRAYTKRSFNLAEKGITDNLWKLKLSKFTLNIF